MEGKAFLANGGEDGFGDDKGRFGDGFGKADPS
jgi:hypothetical protein